MKIDKHKIICDIIDGAYFEELNNCDLVTIARSALLYVLFIDDKKLKWCSDMIDIIKSLLYDIMNMYYEYYEEQLKLKEDNNG